ncbi:MAG: hypothetical protein HZA88_16440 [Verrucomicrobia bacterium]|nr:hypothetical protein [Verrucomicrobiota bacterium]
MNKSRTIEGRWWIHGSQKPAHFGTLTFDPEKGLELTVKVPQCRSNDEAFVATPTEPVSIPNVIWGADHSNNPVTVFSSGSCRFSKAAGLDSYSIQLQAAILNSRAGSWDDTCFSCACVEFTLLNNWINRRLGLETKVEDGHVCYRFKPSDVIEYDINPGFRLRIEGQILGQGGYNALVETRLRWTYRVWFLFPKAAPVQSVFNDYASVFQRLLSLLAGEQVFIETLVLWDRDPFEPGNKSHPCGSELLTINRGITTAVRDMHGAHMITSFPEVRANFDSVVRRWFSCHSELGPVIDLYDAVVSNFVLTDESRFLFLAQALEVYHSRSSLFKSADLPTADHRKRVRAIADTAPAEYRAWIEEKLRSANQKNLRQRLDEILAKHSSEAAQLTSKIVDFAAKVRESRNYYTHYNDEALESGKVAKGLELRRIMFALLDLLQVCFMKELDIGGKAIKRILKRNSSVKWADLDGSQTAVIQS